MFHDGDECYRAVASGDARFDGMFYVAVTSTRIYCRPSCPARSPQRSNCRFYPSAAACQLGGFRACKRCRPDSTPGSPEWRIRHDVAARAVRLIADGVVDRDGVGGLARELAYSERQLNRILVEELGAGPLALARAQRAQTARVLIESTQLTFAEITYAAGFGSIRQFNDTIAEVYASTPRELRARAGTVAGSGTINIKLALREPFAGTELMQFLAMRAINGVEVGTLDRYARTLNLPNGTGTVIVSLTKQALYASFALEDLRDLVPAVARIRRVFDVDVDAEAVDELLSCDPKMRKAIRATPGLRVPGAVDAFEMLVRAIVGQQVSVVGAITVAGRIVHRCGAELVHSSSIDGLNRVFPTAAVVATADLTGIGMPTARIATVQRAAASIANGDIAFDVATRPTTARRSLVALKGIGPWTADYVAMRAFGDPDVFLATDLGVVKGAAELGITGDLEMYSQRWRPFRSYALMHCWNAYGKAPK